MNCLKLKGESVDLEVQGQNKSEVYTIQEAQNILNVCQRTMYRLMKNPPFPIRKVLGQYRIPKVEFDNWLHGKFNDFVV